LLAYTFDLELFIKHLLTGQLLLLNYENKHQKLADQFYFLQTTLQFQFLGSFTSQLMNWITWSV